MWSQKQLVSLTCSQVDNAGLYTCLAESPAGEVEKSFRVRIQGREGVWGQGKRERHGICKSESISHILLFPSPSKCCWAPGSPLCGWLGSRAADPGVLRGSRASPRD